jgi:hypothetical protein
VSRPASSFLGIATLGYYTLKLARPRDGWGGIPDLVARARRAVEDMQGEGIDVHFMRSVFVPEDGACFSLYKAASADDVYEAVRRAALQFDGIAMAIAEPEPVRQPEA